MTNNFVSLAVKMYNKHTHTQKHTHAQTKPPSVFSNFISMPPRQHVLAMCVYSHSSPVLTLLDKDLTLVCFCVFSVAR